MLKVKRKNFVYMVITNQKGLTFVSMLMTLTVIAISLPLLAHTLKLTHLSNNYDELSIQQFTYFLRDEVGMAMDFDVRNNMLHLTSVDDNLITFKKYNDQIIRQVNNKGYDVFVRNVSNIVFVKLKYGIHVTISSLEGVTYEKTIVFPM